MGRPGCEGKTQAGTPVLLSLAIGLAVGLLGVNVYRAVTQSIVQDEALTYHWFLSGPVSTMFQTYDPNHHFLHTYLCKVFVTLFGLSEWSLRLASLLGGAFYLGMVVVLCRFVFGEGWVFLLTAAFLMLHPLVLDFLSAARGYGLALAFFLFSLYHLLRALTDDPGRRRLWIASAGAGLSLASNFSLAYAVGAVSLLFFAAIRTRGSRLTLGAAALHYVLPAAAIDAVLMLAPLSAAKPDQFGTEAKSLLETLRSLARISYAKVPPRPGMILAPDDLLAAVLVVLPMAAAAWYGLRLHGKWKSGGVQAPAEAMLWLAGGATPIVCVAILAIHGASGFDYPEGRTVLFWIPLWGLSAGALAATLPHAGRALATGFLAFSAAQFALQFEVSRYYTWPYDASTRRFAETIAQLRVRRGLDRVRVAASRQLEPALNLYRLKNGYTWMEPVEPIQTAGDSDFYVLLPADQGALHSRPLRPVESDAASTVILAVPAR